MANEKVNSREDQIRKACSELAELLVSKNNDYGNSFSEQYGKYGTISALIRMDDKMRRIETLQKGTTSKVSEKISETLIDLSGYAILAYIEEVEKNEWV